MNIKGIVEDIIFRNEENAYTVVTLDVDGNSETAVGNFPLLSEGESIALEGEYRDTPKYGRQFVARTLSSCAPESEEGLLRFLSSGLIPGIGEVTAANLLETFGTEVLEVMAKEPARLVKVRGISAKKAAVIHESYLAVSGMRAAVIFLQGLGIGSALAIKIFSCYGTQTETLVRANPYRLVEDVDGVGFLTADRIARSAGVKEDSVFRTRAGFMHLIKTAAESNGHTYLPLGELADALLELLNREVPLTQVDELAATLAMNGQIKLLADSDGARLVMLMKYYRLEKGIADKLTLLLRAADEVTSDFAREIANYEATEGVLFHETQKEAVRAALTGGVCVITGGPGTGKTTITKCVLSILKSEGHTVKLLAPTGRAAKRMEEATGAPASTIHRILQSEGEGGKFSRNESNPIEATAVIVDEVSMVDAFLMNALLRAVRPGTMLILVGDRDQLPSVGAGNVLSDILASRTIPNVALTQIFRQAALSRIVTNAHRINAGETPILTNGSDSDFFYMARSSPDEIADTVVELMTKRIPAYLSLDAVRIQVLSPVKAGTAGVINLNRRIQAILNPAAGGNPGITIGETVYRAGDKVMHIVNDYDIEWTRRTDTGVEDGVGVFNGDIGTIATIEASRELTVVFEDGKVVRYASEKLEELMLSYAITVHKSQGCEFDAVIMPVLGGSPMILTRNLLYTGITRAKRFVALVGTKSNLERMVRNDFTQQRYSRLKEFLIAGKDMLLP